MNQLTVTWQTKKAIVILAKIILDDFKFLILLRDAKICVKTMQSNRA